MSKFNSMLESKVMPIAGKMAGQRHLQALRDGIVLTMPLIIIGSVFLILSNLPIPGYNDFMAGIFGKEWATKWRIQLELHSILWRCLLVSE